MSVTCVVLILQARAPTNRNANDTGAAAGEVRDDNSLAMKFVWCPGGVFSMLCCVRPEDAPKEVTGYLDVTLSHGYWIGKYEVSRAEWFRAMGTKPWEPRERQATELTAKTDDLPATFITWNEATEFCRAFTASEREAGRIGDQWEYRLPTEAQWERACRAGTQSKYSYGDDRSRLSEYAWFAQEEWKLNQEGWKWENGASRPTGPIRVGLKLSNPWGLHDMHGNVWEWCSDCHSDIQPGGRDPEVKCIDGNEHHVLRGGSWATDYALCTSVSRNCDHAGCSHPAIGFRVALVSTRR